MPVSVDVPYDKTIPTRLSRDQVYAYLADLEKNMPQDFPGVEAFEPAGPSVYRWRFTKIEYSGYTLDFRLLTRFDLQPGSTITATPVAEPGASRLAAKWTITDGGAGAQVRFEAKLTIELPIPGFLKGMAAPLAQKEIAKLFDRYTARVEKNLSA